MGFNDALYVARCRGCSTQFSPGELACSHCGLCRPKRTAKKLPPPIVKTEPTWLMWMTTKIAIPFGLTVRCFMKKYQGSGVLAPVHEWYPTVCFPCNRTCCHESNIIKQIAETQPHPPPYMSMEGAAPAPFTEWDDSDRPREELAFEREYLEKFGKPFDYSRWRSPNGYGNNPQHPWMGAGKRPYGQVTFADYEFDRPDADKIMEALTIRQGKQRDAPTRSNSMLSWLAAAAIHDFFRTDAGRGGDEDGVDHRNVNVNSSYLEISPIYGYDWTQQKKARTFKGGRLWPNYTVDHRLIAMPCAQAIFALFRRHHNWICEQLPLKYPDQTWDDETLFQQARVINCGVYLNSLLRDYAGGIQGYWPHTDSIAVSDMRGPVSRDPIGFHTSMEFLLLYNFHATIPDYFEPDFATIMRVLHQLDEQKQDQSIKAGFVHVAHPEEEVEPSPEYDYVVKEFVDAMTHPSGAFGPFNAPQWPKGSFAHQGPGLDQVELLLWTHDAEMLRRSRDFQVGSFNDMRQAVGLERFTSFEQFNDEQPEAVEVLKKFYKCVDDVELLPGAVASRTDHYGWGAPSTIHSQAILSDAFSSIRHDRFFTESMTPEIYTEWGLEHALETHTLTLIRMHTRPEEWAKYNIDVAKFPRYMPTGKLVNPADVALDPQPAATPGPSTTATATATTTTNTSSSTARKGASPPMPDRDSGYIAAPESEPATPPRQIRKSVPPTPHSQTTQL